MATQEEKESFINSIQAVIDACHKKKNDGGLTLEQQEVFFRHQVNFTASLAKAQSKDFGPVDSADVADAIYRNNKAVLKTESAEDDITVTAADEALLQAQSADDKVLG